MQEQWSCMGGTEIEELKRNMNKYYLKKYYLGTKTKNLRAKFCNCNWILLQELCIQAINMFQPLRLPPPLHQLQTMFWTVHASRPAHTMGPKTEPFPPPSCRQESQKTIVRWDFIWGRCICLPFGSESKHIRANFRSRLRRRATRQNAEVHFRCGWEGQCRSKRTSSLLLNHSLKPSKIC